MKHFKKILLTGALGVLTLALAGCGGGDKKAEKAKPDTSKPVIVGVNPGLQRFCDAQRGAGCRGDLGQQLSA